MSSPVDKVGVSVSFRDSSGEVHSLESFTFDKVSPKEITTLLTNMKKKYSVSEIVVDPASKNSAKLNKKLNKGKK